MKDITLSQLFDWVEIHKLALPELQRKSVWPSGKVPRLLKSIYEGYPFGMMLLWEPKEDEGIRCRPFKFQDRTTFDTGLLAPYYLIDGQQRLTSFYRALRASDPKVRLEVAFNLETEEFRLPDAPLKKEMSGGESTWYYLHDLLSFGIADWAGLIQDHPTIKIDAIQDKLGNLRPDRIQIPYYDIHHRSYYEVTEIFERINLGLPVSQTQIAVGKLSDRYRGIVGEIEDYLGEQRQRHGTTFDLELVVLALTAVVTGHATVDKLDRNYINPRDNDRSATAATIEQDWERTKAAITEAFRFIEEHLHIDTFRYVGSERAFVCLVYLFANRRNEIDEAKLAYWFAWALLVQYHSRQSALVRDFRLLRDNKTGVEDTLLRSLRKHEVWEHELDDWRKDDEPTNRNNIVFKLMYGAMRSKGAVDFHKTDYLIRTAYVGDTSEEDGEELSDATHSTGSLHLHEHHIYPKARLETYGVPIEEINDAANLTFLLKDTNVEIGDAEIPYLQGIPGEVLTPHLIGGSKRYKEGADGFRRLIKDRRKLIYAALKEYMSELESKVAK